MLPTFLLIGFGLGLLYCYVGLTTVLFVVDDDNSPVHRWAEKSVGRNILLLVFWPFVLLWIYAAFWWGRWRYVKGHSHARGEARSRRLRP